MPGYQFTRSSFEGLITVVPRVMHAVLGNLYEVAGIGIACACERSDVLGVNDCLETSLTETISEESILSLCARLAGYGCVNCSMAGEVAGSSRGH